MTARGFHSLDTSLRCQRGEAGTIADRHGVALNDRRHNWPSLEARRRGKLPRKVGFKQMCIWIRYEYHLRGGSLGAVTDPVCRSALLMGDWRVRVQCGPDLRSVHGRV